VSGDGDDAAVVQPVVIGAEQHEVVRKFLINLNPVEAGASGIGGKWPPLRKSWRSV